MKARSAIDEVVGLSLKVTLTVPKRFYGREITGVDMPVSAIIPTEPLAYEAIRRYVRNDPSDPRDEGFLVRHINQPLIKALQDEFLRKYPAVGLKVRTKACAWISDYIGYNWMNWWPTDVSYKKLELVKPDGTPYDLTALERDYVGGFLDQHESAKAIIDKLAEAGPDLSDEELYLWITDWSYEVGSAVNIWGKPELWSIIKQLIDQGVTIKSVYDPEDKVDFLKNGWELLAEEFNPSQANCDAYEGILIKR